jgi:hypothetical protein
VLAVQAAVVVPVEEEVVVVVVVAAAVPVEEVIDNYIILSNPNGKFCSPSFSIFNMVLPQRIPHPRIFLISCNFVPALALTRHER